VRPVATWKIGGINTVFVKQPDGKRLLRRPRHGRIIFRWIVNSPDWIYLAQDREFD
jgi:hypothetical protein